MSQEKKIISEEAAQYLGVTPACLQKWRQRNQGPSYLKLGSRVYYELQELDEFLVNCKIIPRTSPRIKEDNNGNSHSCNS